MSPKAKPAIDRFWEKTYICMETGCWLWLGQKEKDGYGGFFNGKKQCRAHRFSYEHFAGEAIPAGMWIDHLCRVRNCVNPDHLEVTTPQVNTRRGETMAAANAAKTHCPQGHTLVGNENNRRCVECNRRRERIKAGWSEEKADSTPIAAMQADRTHCPQGHPYDEVNTIVSNGGRKRGCRECQRKRWRDYATKKRAAQKLEASA